MPTDIRPLWIMDSPDHSGTSTANSNLASGMLRAGCKPEIFALRDGENAADFRLLGCPVHIAPGLGRRFFGGGATREAASRGANIVHALSPAVLGRASRLANTLSLPLVVTCNRLDENELRLLAGFPGPGRGIIAVSRALHERAANIAGLPQNRIRVIHNGLDLARMPKPSFPENDKGWRTPVVGTLGHLSEKKGQRVFLQAVKLLVESGLDAEFVILGDGPDRSALRLLADELRVTRRVTFTPQTVSGQLDQLDILVEPSLQEGLGLSVMQAMATGVPVVATGVGGLYDLIADGVNGVMVPASDPAALAGAIRRLLGNRAERLELAKQARATIEREFSADLATERHLEYYKECMRK